MAHDRSRRRVLVPFEVRTFFQAPYGWTSQMRAREGHPRGGRPVQPLGFWRSTGLAVACYGPLVAGGVIGWLVSGGWLGALAGVGAGLVALVAAFVLLAGPVGVARSRARQRESQSPS